MIGHTQSKHSVMSFHRHFHPEVMYSRCNNISLPPKTALFLPLSSKFFSSLILLYLCYLHVYNYIINLNIISHICTCHLICINFFIHFHHTVITHILMYVNKFCKFQATELIKVLMNSPPFSESNYAFKSFLSPYYKLKSFCTRWKLFG